MANTYVRAVGARESSLRRTDELPNHRMLITPSDTADGIVDAGTVVGVPGTGANGAIIKELFFEGSVTDSDTITFVGTSGIVTTMNIPPSRCLILQIERVLARDTTVGTLAKPIYGTTTVDRA